MSKMAWGWVVISFVVGSRIVIKFGWFLALGCSPALGVSSSCRCMVFGGFLLLLFSCLAYCFLEDL